MIYLSNITTEKELASSYRRLALQNHPDKGGSTRIMQMINEEYQYWKEKFSTKNKTLEDVKLNDIVIINRSRSVITQVMGRIFRARSLETGREAYFYKNTGICLSNKKFKATI